MQLQSLGLSCTKSRKAMLRSKRPRRIRAVLIVGIAILVVLGGQAAAQCTPTGSLPDLEKQLNGTLAQLATTAQEQHPAEYRKLQEQALQELEQFQCAREEAAPAEAVKRGPSLKTPFAIVPVLFVTDRQPLQAPDGKQKYFGGERVASGVKYGRAVVRMPAEDFAVGSLMPYGAKMVTEKNAQAGISVDTPENFTGDSFLKAIHDFKSSLPTGEPSRVLMLVHGFNNSYTDAVYAAARLSYGLHVNVLPIAVSWPSQGSILKYWNDEENVEASVERLRPELKSLLTNPDIDEVILVAHSMGSRLVTRVLSQLDLQRIEMPKLTRVAFAAADLFEAEIKELWPRIGRLPSKGWIFYTSANDLALLASSIVHASPPIGDSRNRVFVIPPIDTIDASAVAPKLKGYGHSYLIDNPLLRVDLRRWLMGVGADQRGLTKETRAGVEFWRIHD